MNLNQTRQNVRQLFFAVLLLVFAVNASAETNEECISKYSQQSRDLLMRKTSLLISYNGFHRQANYVEYQLYPEHIERTCIPRQKKFSVDPELPIWGFDQVDHKDYSSSGFDRGHLSPAADNAWSLQANKDSFLTSNISPQTAELNQRSWNNFEAQSRKWVCGRPNGVTIIVGPILKEGLPRIKSCVSVPEQYFKIFMTKDNGEFKAIGFIYNQTDPGSTKPADRVVAISEIEKKTGHKYLTMLPEDIREKLVNSATPVEDLKEWEAVAKECKACPAPDAGSATNSRSTSSEKPKAKPKKSFRD